MNTLVLVVLVFYMGYGALDYTAFIIVGGLGYFGVFVVNVRSMYVEGSRFVDGVGRDEC